jgi:hypothetical protein
MGVALLDEAPESYAARCIVLFTSCFTLFDVAHIIVIVIDIVVDSINGVDGVYGVEEEKVLEQRGTKLTALQGGVLDFLAPPFVQ